MSEYYTPRKKRQETQNTNTNRQLKQRYLQESKPQQIKSQSKSICKIKHQDSAEEAESLKSHRLITKIQNRFIKIQSKYLSYNSYVISKMSSQQHDAIRAYGVSTFKGYRNVYNPHYLGINLGKYKSFSISQSFDGQMAAKIINQQFHNQLITSNIKNSQNKLECIMPQVYNQLQRTLVNRLSERADNSGCTLASMLITKDTIVVANAGCSQIFCETKKGSFFKLSQPHTTLNKNQLNRIVKNGGSIYQTVVNVPFQQQLQIQGPIRIAPSGLMYTRCLGKVEDYKIELKKKNMDLGLYNPNLFSVTWKPEIRYIKTDEVQWIGLFSSSIINNCSPEHIKQIVHTQIKKKTSSWSQHHIAMQISKKIINKMINDGVGQAMSAIIILMCSLHPQTNTSLFKAKASLLNNNKGNQETKVRENKNLLTYSGIRKSFVKSIDQHSKSLSFRKMNASRQQKVQNLKKQRSYQNMKKYFN